ncbi:Ff.00g037590.m01.CDS01 [Fusarium sp. VM40]|nr:Ff.00g037590.m01.CDS01 [Fusarium sp. VM40]
MKSFSILSVAMAALVSNVSAAGVTGTPEGFASEATGGGSAEGAYPKSTDELVSMLGDSTTRVIFLDQEFDFTGTEGTASEQGCAPWGTGAGCQTAINKDDWCNNYQPDAPKVDVSYDKAGLDPIIVNSDKSIVGIGANGVIKGKGLYIKGTKNIIIQNIHITELNPQYVWGGDAVTLDGADLVWIDHVTTSKIGRQHIVLGTNADNRVSITNSHIDGDGEYSATCDGHQYWSMYFTGSSDMITFKNNYITKTSGRAPKVAGNTVLHAVNNYWQDNSGHAFETSDEAKIVAEGNLFQDVKAAIEEGSTGAIFSSPDASANAACSSGLGHVCEVNKYDNSGALSGTDSSFFSSFDGKAAEAKPVSDITGLATSAGFGTI